MLFDAHSLCTAHDLRSPAHSLVFRTYRDYFHGYCGRVLRFLTPPPPSIFLQNLYIDNLPRQPLTTEVVYSNQLVINYELIVQSRNMSHYIQPESSPLNSQQPTNCPYPEPDQSRRRLNQGGRDWLDTWQIRCRRVFVGKIGHRPHGRPRRG